MKNYRLQFIDKCENCNHSYYNSPNGCWSNIYCSKGSIDGIEVSPNGICDEYDDRQGD